MTEPRATHAARKPDPRISPDRWLFPLAALFAAAMVPLWLLLRRAGLASASWHGHELLFGYAMLVAAGFLVAKAGKAATALLLTTWLLARLAATWPAHGWSVLAGLAFPATVLYLAARPLWRGAKRWENRIVPLLLCALLALDTAWWLGAWRFGEWLQTRALLATLDMFSLLMLVIGGRVLPSAVGGFLVRNGIPRRDIVRSGYELPLAGLMAVAMLADLLAWPWLAGLFCLAAAGLSLYRVSAWQLRHARARTELWTLALAYLWLIPGLALKGLAQCGWLPPTTHAVHALTVGALGSLTLVMMARTATVRARQPFGRFGDVATATVLLAMATLLRLAAWPGAGLPRDVLLRSSATLWSLAFLLLLWRLWQLNERARPTVSNPPLP
ncbi:MAG TPA: NnrS family protein [Rhodanobacteraceae bacterium]|nr:NnrS family protein [Rhodanobacteraceae bacterium]